MKAEIKITIEANKDEIQHITKEITNTLQRAKQNQNMIGSLHMEALPLTTPVYTDKTIKSSWKF